MVLEDRKVVVLGLGYVGLPLATVLAEIGFEVCGVDIRGSMVEATRRGRTPFYEPGLAPRLKRVVDQGRLRPVSVQPDDFLADVFIVTVGTPLGQDSRVRLDMVRHVAQEIASRLESGNMVILRSTVKVHTTRRLVKPILDGVGVPYDLAFCPDRTIEGQALSELRRLPQIVAGGTGRAALRATRFFQHLTPTVVRVSSIETAEMIKLVDNAQRDVIFAFSNEVAAICDIVGVQAAEVIRAGKLGYPRTDLPIPGPVGGPCLSKDPYILAESVEEKGFVPDILLAGRRRNEAQPEDIASLIARYLVKRGIAEGTRVSLLGLAFKGRPPIDDLRGTMARPILERLRAHLPLAKYVAFDPVVSQADIAAFGVEPVVDLTDAFVDANVVIILNNHPIFESMPLESLAATMARPGLIYDCWNLFTPVDFELPENVAYVGLGGHTVLD